MAGGHLRECYTQGLYCPVTCVATCPRDCPRRGEPRVLADGFPGGFSSDALVQSYLTADERKAATDAAWDSRWWMS